MITVTQDDEYLLDSQLLGPACNLRQFLEIMSSMASPWKVPLRAYVPIVSDSHENEEA
jgi:hypothetical protein